MRKNFKYIIFASFLFLFSMVGVKAKSELATCNYSGYEYYSGKKLTLHFYLYDDLSLSKPFDKTGESYKDDGFYWTYGKNFSSDYTKALYSNGKVSASCPTIYICNTSSGLISVHSSSVICTDGDTPQVLYGNLEAKENVSVAEDKSKVFCTKNKTLRNASYAVDIKFYLDANGNKRFSVTRRGTNIGADVAVDGTASVGEYSFKLNAGDVSNYYSNNCSKTGMYFDLKGTTSFITIQSQKPSNIENGSTNVKDANNDDGGDAYLDNKQPINRNPSAGCAILGGTGSNTVKLLSTIVKIIRLGIPILVIILGMIDFLTILFSGEEKTYKDAFSRFVKRLLIGVIMIFIPYVLHFLVRVSGVDKQYGIDSFFCGIVDQVSGVTGSEVETMVADPSDIASASACQGAGHYWIDALQTCSETLTDLSEREECEANGYEWVSNNHTDVGYCKRPSLSTILDKENCEKIGYTWIETDGEKDAYCQK